MQFNWNAFNSKKSGFSGISGYLAPNNPENPDFPENSQYMQKVRKPMKHTYFTTCPYCGAHLDPGERCDCPRASPGGYQYGNRTSTESGQVRKPDGCKKCTHAKSAPVQIVHPNLPGLPEIVFSRSKQQPDPGQIEPGSK